MKGYLPWQRSIFPTALSLLDTQSSSWYSNLLHWPLGWCVWETKVEVMGYLKALLVEGTAGRAFEQAYLMTMWWQSLPTFRSRKVFEVRPHSCSKSNPGCLLSVPPGSVLGTFSHIGKWDLDLSGNSGTMLQGLLGKVKFYAWWSNVMHAGGGGHPPLQPNSSFAWHSHPYMGSSHITRVSVFNLEHHN